MMPDLSSLCRKGLEALYPDKVKITVGRATCGRASGAEEVYQALLAEVKERGLDCTVATTGCLGFCQEEPLVCVQFPGKPRYVYSRVRPELVKEIIVGVINQNMPRKRLLGKVFEDEVLITGEKVKMDDRSGDRSLAENPFYLPQVKVATRNCGYIDPGSIAEYVARGGYLALQKALAQTPEEIIQEVLESGLRGRGGGGFPTGKKWDFARKSPGGVKYVICNADEGDPGAYMDRSILEGDPHTVLEGMTIGGYAIGAHTGIIYCRAEYPLAVATLREAIKQAEENGFLGDDIFGSGFSFRIEIVEGRGAFVCGEETALIASIEGKMGEPSPRPPFPAERGLWGKPTNINNVETWANIPPIIMKGGKWFAGMGTENSKGTKVFALVGDIKNNGLVEVPMGTTLRQIIYDIGGGTGVFDFKAVQTGGPSGGCIPASLIDLPVDYEELTKAGAIMGSGGMVVMNEHACMVDVARFFITFTQDESCGKCLPCREGTRQMLELLNKICAGKAEMPDLELLENLALAIKDAALCGLGQTAPSPVLSTLKYFREEYEAHIREKFCPSGVCRELFELTIAEEACRGCGRCAEVCPQQAITGQRKQPYRLDQDRCIRCRACLNTCRHKAIKVVPPRR